MFHPRNLVDHADVERLEEFLMASRPDGGAAYFHVGDLLWGMRRHAELRPKRDHRIWFDERGGVVGFARLYPPADIMMQVLPSLRGMREALVYCKAHNVDFYQAAGFRVTDQYLGFRTA